MNIEYFKNKLEEEKTNLEKHLSRIARQNPKDPEDWQTNPENLNIMNSDPNEQADVFEESASKEAVEKEIEDRLNEIKSALRKIEDGTYGICEKGGCKIEKKRLEVNPAATTCIEHAH
ncbi:MAG: hypothetical protein COT67_01040 [Candidatus Tagabacteria bacterium CG09_land_8_20_14_0_10_41_14]|uniref:Zinc finger DksA/TraR C4-type domain-containing protein n=2 Tax=Candidatus Tagaibacteriota TaxID=1817918 RepID=A0A2H0WNP0_9BACT|nr:MAG: hypothetical protein COT67_01040 [Candidatus Tagabacteria bacterium CG09_land_8_20_14_0_10_41_14]PJE72857.1 MAG: hypothetical protein COV00_03020 [Candidatus Tagabacteria bacterium CG10_big_fil_rev_8_21_14_0_10_40_13]